MQSSTHLIVKELLDIVVVVSRPSNHSIVTKRDLENDRIPHTHNWSVYVSMKQEVGDNCSNTANGSLELQNKKSLNFEEYLGV